MQMEEAERALGTAKDELDTLQLQLRDKKQMQQSKEGERARPGGERSSGGRDRPACPIVY